MADNDFINACVAGDFEVANTLIEQGADIEVLYRFQPLLSFAVEVENFDLFDYLMDLGIDVNSVNHRGETALFHSNDIFFTKRLLECGADINHSNMYGKIPLFGGGDYENCKFLIDNGADIHHKTLYGITTLGYACMCGYLDIIKLFLDYGLDINHQDKDGKTPLFTVLTYDGKEGGENEPDKDGIIKIIKFLLDNGADDLHQDHKGNTFLRKSGGHYGEYIRSEIEKYIDETSGKNIKPAKE